MNREFVPDSEKRQRGTMVRLDKPDQPPRRAVLRAIVSTATIAALSGCGHRTSAKEAPSKASEESKEPSEAEVTPGEDLMQEHGVLERVLLIYEEVARRIDHSTAFDVASVKSAAAIVRHFVEDYHERLEEKFVFPRLQAANREQELVATLLRQHQRGRELTDDITRLATSPPSWDLARTLRSFTRMYRPHAAREDTVLFPAFREVVGPKAYRELGAQFEDQEHARFGEHGFEKTVAEVAELESALGIADLASYTP